METIKIEKPDDPLIGTNLTITCMAVLIQAGITNFEKFELDNEGKTEIIIRVISAQVAEVLRKELPKKGYTLVSE